jgi:hypothetical protein
MALHTELPVYRDTYKLVLEIFVSTKNFPKEYKYSLGRDMERDVLVLMSCIYRANGAQEKRTIILSPQKAQAGSPPNTNGDPF